MSTVARKKGNWKAKVVDKRKAMQDYKELGEIGDIDIQVSLIQALIPIGLKEVERSLQREIETLAGERYKHGKTCTRWGTQAGSVYLAGQKVPIDVPRVRDKKNGTEVPLSTYHKLQEPHAADKRLCKQLLHGLSMHRYEESAQLVPEVFGISGSQVSRRFKQITTKKLQQLQSRDISKHRFVAIFLDGKRFADDGILIALGITLSGQKILLGIEQMNTEHHRPVEQFLNKLIERGLRYDEGLLFVVDGSKGLLKAIRRMFKEYALVQRCWWHKQENVVSYLNKTQQVRWRDKLRTAYRNPDYDKTLKALKKLANELEQLNPSAANSLREGLPEILTIHRLGLYGQLQRSFCTTNCIESIMSQVEHYTQRVDRWRGASHIQRWTAICLLEIEPRLNKVAGNKHLPMLQIKIQEDLKNIKTKQEQEMELVTI